MRVSDERLEQMIAEFWLADHADRFEDSEEWDHILADLRDERARTAAYLEVVWAAKAWRTAECDCNADMYEGSHRPECAVWIAEDSLSSAVDALPAEPAPPAEPGGSAPRKETT